MVGKKKKGGGNEGAEVAEAVYGGREVQSGINIDAFRGQCLQFPDPERFPVENYMVLFNADLFDCLEGGVEYRVVR